MCILTNDINLNNLRFTDDYINGIVTNKDKFIGIPLVVNRSKLESGLYKSLSHEFNKKTGELKTDTIGSFVDFWSEIDGDGTLQLMGSVRIHKRYPNVCNAIIELYENELLEFSCEIVAFGYEDIDSETEVRSVAYSFEDQVNVLLGSCIVTYGAEPKSKANLLVAEAIENDLKGGESVDKPETIVFNKSVEINYHGQFELSSLKFSDVSNMVYNLLNPINPKSNYRDYNYYISDMYLDYVIVEDWESYTDLYKIFYKIENDLVVLDEKSKWIKGYKGFIPEGVDIDSLIASNSIMTTELNNKTTEISEVKKEAQSQMEEKVKELELKVQELTDATTKLNELVVSQKEDIVTLQTKETELNSVIDTLMPFKDAVELAENQAKKDALTEKFTKLLSEDSMKSEQVVNAIESLNEQELNSIVVAEISKEKATKVETKSPTDVIVVASRQDADLIPATILQKYGM